MRKTIIVRDKQMNIRLEESEKRQVVKAAKLSGLSPSQFVRAMALENARHVLSAVAK